MSNMVSLTRSSLKILEKTQTGVFSISGFLVKSLIKKNWHNYRTSNDIDMKPLDQLFRDDVVTANHDLIVIFRSNADLK